MPLQLIETILPLIAVAVGMAVALYLFITLKREIHAASSAKRSETEKLAEAVHAVESRVGQLEREIATLGNTAPPVQNPLPGSGMNLSKRTQALRLIRHGEGPEHIAAALNLPRKEVELLLKVNQIVNAHVAPITS